MCTDLSYKGITGGEKGRKVNGGVLENTCFGLRSFDAFHDISCALMFVWFFIISQARGWRDTGLLISQLAFVDVTG